jgi:hypothetical protein
MATVVQSGTPIPYEYSAGDGATGLFIAMKIYNVTTGTPVLFGSAITMTHVFGGTYFGRVTFPANSTKQTYLVQKSVYTDATYSTILTVSGVNAYGPGSETVDVDGFDQNFGRTA